LAADWAPPADAWAAGEAVDSLWRVRWSEAGDSLALDVSPTGLPRRVRVAPPGGIAIAIQYDRWAPHDHVPWPERVVGDDAPGRVRLTLQVQSLPRRPH